MVALGSSIFSHSHACEVLSLLRILDEQSPALVRVGGRRAWVVHGAVDRAWSSGEVDSPIDVSRHPQVRCVASQIAGGYEKVCRDLPLKAEVPRLNGGRRHIVLPDQVIG